MSRLFRHLTRFTALLLTIASFLALFVTSAAAAPSPWWEIVTGSRPTNLWEPSDNVQKIESEIGEFGGEEGAAARIEVGGESVGCLGTTGGIGQAFCEGFYLAPPSKTAAELEAVLETAFGTDAVTVTGGPVGGAPFEIVVPDRSAPPIVLSQETGFELGTFKSQVLSNGGSGRLVVTLLNLGDAPVDATGVPLTITDKLPAGVEATGFEAVGGVQNKAGPVDCEIPTPDEVTCTFEDVLPSFEAIEIEIFASLTEKPPVAMAPGKVTVSGGDAPTASEPQPINVSPEKVPFGIEYFSAQAEEEGGSRPIQAGRHPFQMTTTIQFNSGPMKAAPIRRESSVEQPAQPRNLRFPLPAGLIGNVAETPTCSLADFYSEEPTNDCPPESAVGAASVLLVEERNVGFARLAVPVFNLPAAPGEPARLGFTVTGVGVVIDTAVDPNDRYRVVGSVNNASQVGQLLSSSLTLWGTPGDPRHDSARGWNCVYKADVGGPCVRPSGLDETPFLRLPVTCSAPLEFRAEVEPWNAPLGSAVDTETLLTEPLFGCNQIPFDPTMAVAPTSRLAAQPSGLDFSLTMPNAGLLSREAISEGQAKKVEVTLPEGVAINPSQADGLAACSPADLARETATSAEGAGCPEASKVGDVRVRTPLLTEEASGSLYVATPHENPFDSLIALYMVAKIPSRGILIKQAGKVTANPVTGQLTTTFDDLPQIPFSTFELHFREGPRAPLVMPQACGGYGVVAKFTPWHAGDPGNPSPQEVITRTGSLPVERGSKGGNCPSGVPPFRPDFSAGTLNNAAGKHSQLNVRLTREDDEQEFRAFSVKLPKGVIGKLAGVPLCSDAAVAAARARTGEHGGQEELERPSCPSTSKVGRLLVGVGAGPSLTYVPGNVYLGGPYKGSKLSVVAITPARVGPFDLGNVVIRQALKVNPRTAQVTVDSEKADPIPRILQGIPVRVRDVRVYVDRPRFVLNPTSCERMETTSDVVGAGSDLGSPADDSTVEVSAPFQAASCASLGFKPKLTLRLSKGSRRAFPKLRAVLRARKGDANIGTAQVTLPRTTFLEQAHIRTICTRVQFNAGAGNGERCPKAAVYGRAKAISPLLDEPLVGPVFLRSSNHELPDLVAALHSKPVDINLVGRIDSVKGGGIRSTFQSVPDAPVTKFTLEMQGGRKGLIVNSTDLCNKKQRARASFVGQNGRRRVLNPVVKARCGKGQKQKGNKQGRK